MYFSLVIKNKHKMTKEVESTIGEITVRNAMIDIDGTNLQEGVEIVQDGVVINEWLGYVDLDDEEEVEKLLMHFDLI
jgi:hypothetical protein